MANTASRLPHAEPRTPLDRGRQAAAVRRTLAIILALNGMVVAVKVVIGIRTNALSVLGAALESTLDMLNNIVGMMLVTVAAREPDENHPYGHDKFETIGALAIVGFLSISCFELLREAIASLRGGDPPLTPSVLDIGLLAATVGVNVLVVWFERRRGRALNSTFLLADATHTGTDTVVTLLALTSLVVTRFGLGALDPWLALVVALVIAWSGLGILRSTIPILVDERAVEADRVRVLVGAIPNVGEVRAVRSRSAPSGVVFAEVTIAVDASLSVAEAHALADEVEARIERELGLSEVTVHVEPI